MRYEGRYSGRAAAAALAVLMFGCSTEKTNLQGTGQATISLSQTVATSAASLSDAATDSAPPGFIPPSAVDSLVVVVTAVEVLPDSVLARHHPGERWGGHDGGPGGLPPGPGGMGGPGGGRPEGPGPFGPHGMRDSLRLRDSTMLRDSLGWGRLPEDWYSLDVVGTGHLDLMHLPTDSTSGLALAVGTVPAGTYAGARLLVSSVTIWFDSTITAGGTTFNRGTGYAVTLPPGPDAGIRTRAGFTIADGATEVQLVFDPRAAVRGAFVTPSGQLVMAPPPMDHHEHRH